MQLPVAIYDVMNKIVFYFISFEVLILYTLTRLAVTNTREDEKKRSELVKPRPVSTCIYQRPIKTP